LEKFIYAYDIKTKDKLEKLGYDLLNETMYKGKEAFLFVNKENNKINFTNDNLEFSNKLCF
jgi:hypothetical protein